MLSVSLWLTPNFPAVRRPAVRYSRGMNPQRLQSLLKEVQAGELSIDAAMQRMRRLPFENLPFAMVDQHRALRCGHGEVIFCRANPPYR